ncbi:MAG: diguanylate cyclase [Inhella sp.]|jgi:diguanylate cyclase (GGDEF)-like protein|nr:diguanylate cyclase [Inhella sp.]
MDLPLPPQRGLHYAPVLRLAPFGSLLALLLAGLALLFSTQGLPRPMADWSPIDLLSEGGLTLALAVWLGQLRASRPAGPVTDALALGLAAWMLGGFVDLCDELWLLPKTLWWDNLLESGLIGLGMLSLTWGLHGWRREQLQLSEQLRRRERGLRDPRRQDRVTRLADDAYMAQQIEAERGRAATLVMLGFEGFDAVLRESGLAEADRLLANAAELLCLNLGDDDLVCRYGGDRFVLLLPAVTGAQGEQLAATLRSALAALSHVAGARRWQLPVRAVHAELQAAEAARPQMLRLARRLG